MFSRLTKHYKVLRLYNVITVIYELIRFHCPYLCCMYSRQCSTYPFPLRPLSRPLALCLCLCLSASAFEKAEQRAAEQPRGNLLALHGDSGWGGIGRKGAERDWKGKERQGKARKGEEKRKAIGVLEGIAIGRGKGRETRDGET
jgi:hypothetical protein